MTQRTIVLTLAVLAGMACAPKKDTAHPDGEPKACTEEAKQCADGSSVVREGPNCEFPACPGEGEADGEPEPSADADADASGSEAEPADGSASAPADGE